MNREKLYENLLGFINEYNEDVTEVINCQPKNEDDELGNADDYYLVTCTIYYIDNPVKCLVNIKEYRNFMQKAEAVRFL